MKNTNDESPRNVSFFSGASPDEIEEFVHNGIQYFTAAGMTQDDADAYVRQVFLDMTNFCTMLAQYPLFSSLLDLVEVIGDNRILAGKLVHIKNHDESGQNDEMSGESLFKLKTIADLIWSVYLQGLLHGGMRSLEREGDIDKDVFEQLVGDTLTFVDSIRRAYNIISHMKHDDIGTSSVVIENDTAGQNTAACPVYKNTAAYDF